MIKPYEPIMIPDGTTGKQIDFRAAVVRERLDLQRKEFFMEGIGEMSHVIFAAGEVFKSPRHVSAVRMFKIETAIMHVLKQAKNPLMPVITTVGKQAQFYGMTQKPGVRLSQVFNDLTAEEKSLLAADIADCKLEIEKSVMKIKCGLKKEILYTDEVVAYAAQFLRHAAIRCTLEEAGVFKPLRDYIKRYFKRPRFLRHGDLHEENILIDPETKKVSGVVDWNFAAFSRAHEVEFSRLYNVPTWAYQKVTKDFARAAFSAYCDKTGHAEKHDMDCFALAKNISGMSFILDGSDNLQKRQMEFLLSNLQEECTVIRQAKI